MFKLLSEITLTLIAMDICCSTIVSGRRSSSSDSRSSSRSSSSSDDGCGCELDSILSELTAINDRFEIEQLIYGLQYTFDDITNSLGTLDDFVEYVEANSIENLTALVEGATLQLNGVDEFTAAIGFIGSVYLNHYIISGGPRYEELTSNYARVRVNQANFSIQFGKMDYTMDVTIYEFVKVDGQWKFSAINGPIAFDLCVVGSAFTVEDGCENPAPHPDTTAPGTTSA